MTHQIAMSQVSSVGIGGSSPGDNLFVAFLDANGAPWAFQQTPDGTWKPKILLGLPDGVAGFSAILGLNSIFLALSNSASAVGPGMLYFTENAGAGWGVFAPLTSTPDGFLQFFDFSAAWIGSPGFIDSGFGLVVAAIGGSANEGYYVYTQCGLPGNMSGPIPILDSQSVSGGVNLGGPGSNCLTVLGMPGSDLTNGNGLGAVLYADGSPVLRCWINVALDGISWSDSPVPTLTPGGNIEISSVVAAIGNPDRTVQALLLANLPDGAGAPMLAWNASLVTSAVENNTYGSGWVTNYGVLPDNGNTFIPYFFVVAAANNNQNVLQVIGIGTPHGLRFPYLIWQDAGGNWFPYLNDNQSSGAMLPNQDPPMQITDLAISIGGQGYLQVGYIGTDGNIYVNWQDHNGNWYWYAGLTGAGLP